MKRLIVAIIMVVTYTYTFAQDLEYGPKVGMNISHVFLSSNAEETNNLENKTTVSAHFGGFLEIYISDYITIQPELLYTVKGTRFTDSSIKDYKSRLGLKYLSLPVVGKYYIKDDVSVEAGGYISYLLSGKDVEHNSQWSTSNGTGAASVNFVKDAGLKTFDAGVCLGATYKNEMGYYFGLRYEYGLINLFESDSNMKMNNGNIMLSLGFSMRTF